MTNELITQTRERLKNLFGAAFAAKATDEFCQSYFTEPLHTRTRGREILDTGGGASHGIADTIIELKKDDSLKELSASARSFSNETHRRATEALRENPEVARELEADLRRLEYDKKAKKYKENAIKSFQSVNAFLDKGIERSFAREVASVDEQAFLTRYCWLNQSARTIAKSKLLAEIVEDERILALDVPRRLQREIDTTGGLIKAIQFRQQFKRTGKNIRIGIIDSEIDMDHKALLGRITKVKNFTKEPWGTPDRHGTAVAGIIGSNDKKFSGMAPGAQLFNYKVLATVESLDSDNFEGGMAIQKAVEDSMHIINCSWGNGPVTSKISIEAKACNTAWELGIVVVKSAGNNGPKSNSLTRPAEADGIIVVGATGKDGKKAEDYSSRGTLSSGEKRPHLLAPGGNNSLGINSCFVKAGFGDAGAGTSYAAPHVTGLLALILEEHPHLSPDELRDFVIKLSKKLKGVNAESQGAGFISFNSLVV